MGKASLTVEEQERIKVLHAEGKTYHAIAKEVGRSPHTVKGYLVSPTVQEEVVRIKGELGDMFEGLAKRMIDSITDEEIKKLDAYRRTLSGAVATDKMRLLRDKSTANVAIEAVVASVHERLEGIEAIKAALESRLVKANE